LRADVVTAFFDVVAAQEGYQLALASQQLAQRVSDAAARRVMAGKVSPVEQTRLVWRKQAARLNSIRLPMI
jgi:cobalt-zinc-cadmium efflux system outer membrane protein